jgi:hypothetical protein
MGLGACTLKLGLTTFFIRHKLEGKGEIEVGALFFAFRNLPCDFDNDDGLRTTLSDFHIMEGGGK